MAEYMISYTPISGACRADREEEFIDGKTANLSYGDSALSHRDNP